MVGLQRSGAKYKTEPDRKAAIALATRRPSPGDIVLIAGKGHEKMQVTRDGSIPFDDVEVAHKLLRTPGYECSPLTRRPGNAMKLPLARVAEFLTAGGEFDPKAIAQAYSIDSRTIQPGEPFFRRERRAHGWARFCPAGAAKEAP